MFSVDLRTNNNYYTVQHVRIYFYNRGAVCLLRGSGQLKRDGTRAETIFRLSSTTDECI